MSSSGKIDVKPQTSKDDVAATTDKPSIKREDIPQPEAIPEATKASLEQDNEKITEQIEKIQAGESTDVVEAAEETPVAEKSAEATPAESKSENSVVAPTVKGTKKEEDDLDDLDDLLDEFADDVLAKPPGSTINDSQKGSNAQNDPFSGGIADLISEMKIDDPESQKQFADLVKQFENNHRDEVEKAESDPNNFELVMKDTMERLKKSGSKIDEQAKSGALGGNGGAEDMLQQLLAGMGGEKDGDMSKLLVDMLEQLSSKDVLYEPIKDLNSKFPAYLKENESTLSEDKLLNYKQQYETTVDILAVFDAPGYDDNDKQKREKVNVLLEHLQDLGQPPAELVGDLQDFPGFGAGGPGAGGLDFDNTDLPKDIEKELAEGCQQQ